MAAALGDLTYRAAALWKRLPGNITTTKQFLSQTGSGAASAVPAWATISGGDVAGFTAGSVIFGSSTGILTQDNAHLFWDDTNDILKVIHGSGVLDSPQTNESPQIFAGGDFDGVASGVGILYLDGYGAQPNITMRRANGTQASKSALADANIIFNFRSYGWDGSAYGLGGLLRMVASGAWTGSNHGEDLVILLTANASVATPSEVVRVRNNASGTVGININAPSAALEIRGTPADIGYLIKSRPTGTGSAYIQMSANGASNQAGFSYTQLSNSFEWRNAIIGNDENALRWGGGSGGTDVKMYLTQTGNLILNDTNIDPTTGTKCLVFGDGTAPATLDSNSAIVYANDVSGTVNIFVINEAGDVNQISGDIKIASGKFFFTQAAAFMIKGLTSYTDGAGALTGTLTNSPKTGNPTKWIAIDDNGTTRYIPAW